MKNNKKRFILPAISRICRLQGRDDERGGCPQGRNIGAANGFTLIELLVVVLIIGILAAVAVPQYQKAVVKSRLVAAITYVKAVKDAEEVYYMANGSYTNDMTNLDVSATCPKDFTCKLMDGGQGKAEAWYSGSSGLVIAVSFDHRAEQLGTVGKIYCWGAWEDDFAKKVCSSMGPLLDDTGGGIRHAIAN